MKLKDYKRLFNNFMDVMEHLDYEASELGYDEVLNTLYELMDGISITWSDVLDDLDKEGLDAEEYWSSDNDELGLDFYGRSALDSATNLMANATDCKNDKDDMEYIRSFFLGTAGEYDSELIHKLLWDELMESY